MRRESLFQSEIKRGLDSIRYVWSYKIPDIGGINDKLRFSLPRPFDIVGAYKGLIFAIELKQLTDLASIPFDMVSLNQWANLRDVYEVGGKSLVIVNFKNKSINQAVVIPFKFYMELKEKYKGTRKSIPIKELEFCQWLTRKKIRTNYGWDLECLFAEGV